MSEFKLQRAIVDHLDGIKRVGNKIYPSSKPFDIFACHIFQGRSKEEGFYLKMLGVKPGVADLMILWKDGIGFLEVKTFDGRLSSAQKKFKGICHFWGIKWALVRSVKEAHDQLLAWGLKPFHNAVSEPDLRTYGQKLKDAEALWGEKKYEGVADLRAEIEKRGKD